MSIPDDRIEAFKKAFPDAYAFSEAGIDYVKIPNMPATLAGMKRTLDVILCPMKHGGYTTRLFLPEQISSKGQNWTVHIIQGKPWHTFSFNNVPSTLSLHEILLAHLMVLA